MVYLKHFLWIVIFALLLVGCSTGLIGVGTRELAQTTPQGSATSLAAIAPDASATPTPFMPVPPTPTYIPTAFPTPIPTATPEPPPTPRPTKDFPSSDEIDYSQEQVNILLLGSDQRPGEIGFRTDTIILLSINTRTKKVSMTSFPRDLYVYIPGWVYQRINTAMYYGGFATLAETLEYNFDVSVDHYILIGLDAFIQTIDSLGGIDVQVGQTLSDHRTAFGYYTVKAGTVHMDGSTALWYARSRYTTSDFDRTRRQQEVISAIARRMLSLDGLQKADELYDIYHKNVSSDLRWVNLAPLVPLAAEIGNPDTIQQYYIGPGQVIPWTTPGGAMVLLPQEAAIRAVLQQAVGVP